MNNGNLTKWSPIWSVLIRMISKIVWPRSGSPIFLITSMITDRIGRQKGQLPINQNNDKIWEIKETRYQLYVFINTKNNSLLGEMRDNSARTWRVLSPHSTSSIISRTWVTPQVFRTWFFGLITQLTFLLCIISIGFAVVRLAVFILKASQSTAYFAGI